MSEFIIKQNDTLPALEAQLINTDGSPLNLELCVVRFHMIDGYGKKKVNREAVITDEVTGCVKFNWQSGETDTPGIHRAEFEVVFPDDTILTVPNDAYFIIKIIDELA